MTNEENRQLPVVEEEVAASAEEEMVSTAQEAAPEMKKLKDPMLRNKILWVSAAAVVLLVVALLVVFLSSERGLAYPVHMSEILASNTRFPNGDGRCTDYIELYNGGDISVDISGFLLGDVEGSGRYAFPVGTVLEPGAYLTVYCDSTVNAPGYAPFGISRAGGEVFYLIATNGAIVDRVVTLPTDLDQSMVLEEDGWTVSRIPTPGKPNSADQQDVQGVHNDGVSAVCISEFSVANTLYFAPLHTMCDWVELHNTSAENVDISGYILSDNVGNDKYAFPQGTVIAPGAYHLVYCAETQDGEGLAPFGLSKQGGEMLVLKDAGGMIVEIADSLPMETGSQIRGEDGRWTACDKPSPGFANTQEGHTAFLKAIGANEGAVVISELMSAEQLILPDAWGDFPDWAELLNTGSETVQLEGWYLSDDPTNPKKWQLPRLEIPAGERALLYLSGRETVKDGQVHAGFSLSAGGESLVLSSYLGTVVDSVSFGEATDNTSFICGNGKVEPCDKPTPGWPNDDTGYESFCNTRQPLGSLAIWEVMTENDWYLPQGLGQCYDWVELKNISGEAIELSDYCISDDPDTPQMFPLPAGKLQPGEMVVIILSGDTSLSNQRYAHGNFALNGHEDKLLVYGKDGKLVDYAYLSGIPVEYSYGREADKGGFFYMKPTPGAANKTGNRSISAEPTSQVEAGVHVCTEQVTVPLDAAGTIYYTLDGSDPTKRSKVYSEPLQITDNTVLRAAALEDGKLLSKIYTATFIFQRENDLPVVSLVTDPDNLWSETGIYKDGDKYIKEETRAGNVSYTGEDGSFSMDCRINMHGASTLVKFPKKSFTVNFREAYDGILNYDVFEDGEVTQFTKLIIRNAYEGNQSTNIRDNLMAELANRSGDLVVTQKYKYIAFYLNGEYWGLYALRELHSAEHYGSYMNVPADTVIKVHYAPDRKSTLSDLYYWLENHDLKSDQNFARAEAILDIDSLIDWIIFEAYSGNFDIYSNIRYYHSSFDGIWRMGLADVDLGMYREPGFVAVKNSVGHSRLMSALMGNEGFCDRLSKRLAELLSTTFSDESVVKIIDEMSAIIRPEVPQDAQRWDYSVSSWEWEVEKLKRYCQGRGDYLVEEWCDIAGYTDQQKEAYFGQILK